MLPERARTVCLQCGLPACGSENDSAVLNLLFWLTFDVWRVGSLLIASPLSTRL